MSSGQSSQSECQQPQYRERSNGFWQAVSGDGTLFSEGADGAMRQVLRIRDMTGSVSIDERNMLRQYLMVTNFINDRHERVEFTIANIV